MNKTEIEIKWNGCIQLSCFIIYLFVYTGARFFVCVFADVLRLYRRVTYEMRVYVIRLSYVHGRRIGSQLQSISAL